LNQGNGDEEEIKPERGNGDAVEVEGEVESKQGDDVEPDRSASDRRLRRSEATDTRRGPPWSGVMGTRRGSQCAF